MCYLFIAINLFRFVRFINRFRYRYIILHSFMHILVSLITLHVECTHISTVALSVYRLTVRAFFLLLVHQGLGYSSSASFLGFCSVLHPLSSKKFHDAFQWSSSEHLEITESYNYVGFLLILKRCFQIQVTRN